MGTLTRRRRGALLLGLALVLGGLAAADVNRREKALETSLAPLVPVVVAARDVPPGRALAARDLAVRQVPRRYAPVDAAQAPEEVLGQRLAVPVRAGATVGPALAQVDAAGAAGAPVGRGERAADLIALGAPDLVVPGAHVDVLVTREGEAGAAGSAELALEDVEVLAARGAPESDAGPRVAVTLRVTVRQAVYLAAAQSFAREVRLLPRAAGDRRRTGGLRVGEALG